MIASQLGRVFITGADGFIGSHLTEKLVQLGCDVTALCIYNSTGNYGWLKDISEKAPKNLNLILGDIRDPYFMQKAIQGHDTVFHLASLIAIPYSYVAPQSYIETNISGTLNVAQAAIQAKCNRLIHTSTSEVYGTAQFVPITEEHPLQGQSPYSASKIGADKIIESFVKSFELPAVTLRPFNTYGPRQSMRAVLPTIVTQIVSGIEEIHLGSLSPTRDFNEVSDTVNAFIAVATAKNESVIGQTFNTGTGREISVGDVTQLIAKLLGKKIKVHCTSERIRPPGSEVERLLGDSTKLRTATGWAPQMKLEDGLVRLADWIQKNQPVSAHLAQKYHT